MTRTHTAEDVLPGHPDRVADAVAEIIVDHAVGSDPSSLVGVEVAVHRNAVIVTGRVAMADVFPLWWPDDLPNLVKEAVWTAGYRGRWGIVEGGYAGDRGRAIEDASGLEIALHSTVECDLLTSDEEAIRGFSDDQNLVVGHAEGGPDTGWLPPAVHVARRLRVALGRLCDEHADVLGPDGKVWVRFIEEGGRDMSARRFQWDRLNVAVQHVPGADHRALHALVTPAMERELAAMEAYLPGLRESWSPERFRLNGAGDFSCGGPFGDNGLSGKKLVVDHYGPGVPIGGGALCGKDPYKVDRAGALRARQLAVRLVRDASAREATVRLGWLPGLTTPSFIEATVDGEAWDEARIAGAIRIPDLSLEATYLELELNQVEWMKVMRAGYFGGGWRWE